MTEFKKGECPTYWVYKECLLGDGCSLNTCAAMWKNGSYCSWDHSSTITGQPVCEEWEHIVGVYWSWNETKLLSQQHHTFCSLKMMLSSLGTIKYLHTIKRINSNIIKCSFNNIRSNCTSCFLCQTEHWCPFKQVHTMGEQLWRNCDSSHQNDPEDI